jgi:hypothetical protein
MLHINADIIIFKFKDIKLYNKLSLSYNLDYRFSRLALINLSRSNNCGYNIF